MRKVSGCLVKLLAFGKVIVFGTCTDFGNYFFTMSNCRHKKIFIWSRAPDVRGLTSDPRII